MAKDRSAYGGSRYSGRWDHPVVQGFQQSQPLRRALHGRWDAGRCQLDSRAHAQV